MEIGKNQQRRVHVSCRGVGIKAAVDPNADKDLMEKSWKRRNAMRSSKNAIFNLLHGNRGHTQAWGLCNGSDADHAFDDDNLRSKNFWMFNDFSPVDMESGEIPGFNRLALYVPKIVIIHDEKTIPCWLKMYVYVGGCFLMSTQCFTTCGEAGFCVKHVPNIAVTKTLYTSGKFRDKSPKMAVAMETIVAKTPFSKWNILVETKKDHVIAKARANATRARANGRKPANQTTNLWPVTTQEKEDYAGIRIVMNVPLFIDYATCIDRNLTLISLSQRPVSLTGLCGH